MNWPLFINLLQLEVVLVAFVGIALWTARFLKRGVWR